MLRALLLMLSIPNQHSFFVVLRKKDWPQNNGSDRSNLYNKKNL